MQLHLRGLPLHTCRSRLSDQSCHHVQSLRHRIVNTIVAEFKFKTSGEMTGRFIDGDHFIDNDLRLATFLIGAADKQNDRTRLNVLGEAGKNV